MQIQMASVLDDVQALKTGTFVDKMTGLYGLPKGRIIEFWGEENTGKTTLALQVVAEAQRQGEKCLWVDVERTLDPKYARGLGVDTAKLGLIVGIKAEEIVEAVLEAVESGKWKVIVIDSIGSLSSRNEIEKGVAEKTIGLQASLMTRFVRLSVPYIHMHNIVFIGVNHQRIDLDGKIYTLGGKLWSEKKKFALRLRVKPGVVAKTGEKIVGKVIRANVTKNHVGPTEGMEVQTTLLFGTGYSQEADLLQEALDRGIITKKGAGYFMGEDKLAHGQAAMRELLKDDAFTERIKRAIGI